ncbi:MAG: protecting protein DprA protein [Candidatus Beckwithbacteria bacterium GW2011_GWA2_43_10]|uniref:Protecting protein DprA protein n=1 Tax=Candidatus Beckwithbacteria bacterium GW2011_GWA2_43_10 TaxID=1618369 RepID=A0A0G1C3K8_9BACT|nr:MAG: protecting protein DprA protein [Candidatus Beckwithbacteria bacterium GW2011_GWA2_43_10]
MREWKEWEIKLLKYKDFPAGLQRVRPKVKQLFYRGEWKKDLFDKAVAVVGSRKITKYGRMATEMMVRGLTEAGYTIVSGFMYGVDTAAHKTCLENKGRTVAVLGCGLDCLTPAENDSLYTKILENGGLVVSEFTPKQEAKLWTFPYRNRIVAGLSQAVLVIEAGEKSGSLVTARWAFQQKKKVLAVPGMITASLSKGTNWLIKNGAGLARDANDILEELGGIRPLKEKRKGRILPKLRGEEAAVVEWLKREEMDADELSRKLNKSITQINILLSELCLKGVVEESGNKFMLGLEYVD